MEKLFQSILSAALLSVALAGAILAQPPTRPVRTVTIPISIFTKDEMNGRRAEELIQADNLAVLEDGDEQTILSIKSVSDSPLSIAILIQEDLDSGFNLQTRDIQQFIRDLPQGTRVMVAYLRGGSPEIRQKFTDDREAAARSLRIVSGQGSGPRSPYGAVSDILSRFDATPAGRRAILLFSDGLDTTNGLNMASIMQSSDLDQAVIKSQRRSVAIYSLFYPTEVMERSSSILSLAAQGALDKLSDETGGRAFAQGPSAPISFAPSFSAISRSLNRQFALTYLSTHMKKGYHKVKVTSTNPRIKIVHPRAYNFR